MTRWDVPQRRKAVCWSVCAVDLYKEWAGSCPVWAQRPPGSANLETFQSHCRGRKNEKIFIACMQRLYTDIKALETNLLHERSWVDLITTTQSQMSQRGQFLQDGETVCRHKHAITGMRKHYWMLTSCCLLLGSWSTIIFPNHELTSNLGLWGSDTFLL